MNQIEEIKQWFAAAVPQPGLKNAAVQIGCHYEEVLEMVDVLAEDDLPLLVQLDLEASWFKSGGAGVESWIGHVLNDPPRAAAMLDALCDQIVTAVGVAHMMGFDIAGALAEVNRSNFSKFENGCPVFDENGKIRKGKDYTPPDLARFVCKED